MKKTIIMAIIISILGSYEVVDGNIIPLKVEDFQVGKLYLGQSIYAAIGIYGKPTKIGKTVAYRNNKNANMWKQYCFDGIELEISTQTKKIYDISVHRIGLQTPHNVGVGSKVTDIFKYYGKVDIERGSLVYEKYDSVNERTYIIEFVITNSIVKRINIYFAWE